LHSISKKKQTDDIDQGRFGKNWEGEMRKYINGYAFAALYLLELDPGRPSRNFTAMRNHAC
jgi:hypothetical protein